MESGEGTFFGVSVINGMFVQDVDGSLVEIAGNDLATVDTGVWLATGIDMLSTTPSRIVVAGWSSAPRWPGSRRSWPRST